jgi:RND family efflux transporter MFP subunit
MMRNLIFIGLVLILSGCEEEDPGVEKMIRGLKTHEVSEVERFSLRKFPAVLEPSEITTLSFEVSGKLQEILLNVGQQVSKGDILARLDPASLQLQVEVAETSVVEANASAQNAVKNLKRQQELFERGATTRVVVDDARTQSEISDAGLDQAQKSLETAINNLDKAQIKAPFDGIVNSVEVESFATVGVATPITQIYPSDGFEVAFSVNFDTVNRLVVGKSATVRLADRPDITLNAVVSEIGSRADAVSSFPIVLELKETNPLLKAGMAVEAAIEFKLAVAEGYTVPLTVVINDGKSGQPSGPGQPSIMGVYVFDPDTSTVKRREVTVGGISGNSLIIIDGLQVGEQIASAGVSFLQDGQEVKLLGDGE